jgi:TonB family protein
MSDPGWPPASPEGPQTAPESAGSQANAPGFESELFESDLAELAAKFAAHGGESFPADLSAELALEIVLNEIVEQACLATGATGAAVVLERDGEMVCRASSGPTAPELGSRQDVASGLSGECIRTGQTQRCDDAETDPRADAAASQRLGVRSAMVLPLVDGSRGGRVVGLFEVFSPRAWAFGDRDERTLEALSVRVMRNLERAAEPPESLFGSLVASPLESSVGAGIESGVQSGVEDRIEAPVWSSVDGVPAAELLPDNSQLSWETASVVVPIPVAIEDEPGPAELVSLGPSRRFDVVGWALGAVVLACTVLMAVLVVERMGPQHARSTRATVGRASVRQAVARPTTAASGATNSEVTVSSVKNASQPGGPIPTVAALPASSPAASAPIAVGSHARSVAPAGSLLVFENGKEVFRLPPSQGQAEQPSTTQAAVEKAASVTPERVVALSPAAAESSLIHRVEPEYPEEARNRQLQGPVVLDIHIGQNGTVLDTKLVSGEPLLADAAVAAVSQWRFRPRLVDGAPAEMQTRITLNFRLSK